MDHLDCDSTSTGSGNGAVSTGCQNTTHGESQTSDTTSDTAVTTADDATTVGSAGSDSDSGGSSSSGGSDTGSSTGEPMAVCGNGVVEEFGPTPEDCDDANDDPADGCSDCGRDRIVFITSLDYQGSVFEGISGADQRCGNRAGTVGLPNFLGYKAWISDSKVSAKDRMFRGRGRYVLVNGLVVADNWEALLAGELQIPINVTETSETKNYQVWTGTMPDGTAAVGADHCADWSESNDANSAFWGRSEEISGGWTIAESPFDQPGACNGERALYCFEQG